MKYATFSDCGRFRHRLHEVWDPARATCVWLLANPSIASAEVDDPTWRKGRGFSRRMGYGSQIFVNVFDFIATDPKDLARAGWPRSPRADDEIIGAALQGDGTVICAWGAVLRGRPEPDRVADSLRRAGFNLACLGVTSLGEPRHPLMLAYDTTLRPYP